MFEFTPLLRVSIESTDRRLAMLRILSALGTISLQLIAAAAMAVSTAQAGTLLTEDFEDGSLDPRISISTLGTFFSAPGIKPFSAIEGSNAFGFGRSTCRFSCFGSFVTDLTISFDSPTFVTSISFNEMEVFDNWGSDGVVFADGLLVAPSLSFGRLPYNDRQADTAPRLHEFAINMTVSQIRMQVSDITDLSEIYLDQISVVPEPSSASLLVLGICAAGVAARRRFVQ